jgi:adenosylcobinamide-phosphate synthase
MEIIDLFLTGMAGGARRYDPLALLLGALILDAFVGEMAPLFRWVPHPIAALGYLIGFLENKLNREHRSERNRNLLGIVLVLLIAGLAAAIGYGITMLATHQIAGQALELFIMVLMVSQRSLFVHVRAVGRALRDDGLSGGRRAVAHIVGRAPESLDKYGIARAAIESLGENFSDAVVAPVFWYVIFGLPGILAYKAVNTMDSMVGHMSPRYRAFGMAAARTDDLLNLVPARLSGLFIAAAALFVSGGAPLAALRTMWCDAMRHRSPNAGWPEAAMAGALGLALAGPRHYSQQAIHDSWIGVGTTQATHADIRRALHLFVAACIVQFLATTVLLAIRANFNF